MKKVLTIAGSDCSGGAGIQADLKTMSTHGVFAMSVIVSVVAENTARVISIEDISPKVIEDQMDAVFEDIFPDAVKVGMLSTPPCMQAVARKLRQYQPKLTRHILPLATVLTPNIPEAECIAKMEIHSVADMEEAARRIHAMGCKNVLVKGGHAVGNALDVLYDGQSFHHFENERIDTKNTHGTGCTLSSAIASNLALGHDVVNAVGLAKDYVTEGIRHSLAIGKGCGPLNHFHAFFSEED